VVKRVQAQTYTLQDVLDSIDARNPGLQQFALKTKSSFAEGDASKAWMAPTAGLGLSEFPYGNYSKTGNGMMPRKMLMLRLQQMFPNFSKQQKEQDYYQSFAAQNTDDRETMKNLLFARAKMAYYDAYVAEKKLAVISQQEKQIQLLIQIAEGRLAYNKASLPNIYKARAKFSDLQSMRIEISSKVGQTAAILNSLMNRPVEAPLQVDTSVNLLQQSVNILAIDSIYVRTQRSDIRRITDEIHSMNLKQQVASSMSKPVFGITWDNMRMPVSTSLGKKGMYMFNAMATISIPIAPWFSKGYKSKINAMDYQIQAMQKIKENQVLKALGNIHKNWLSLQSSKRDLQIFKNEVIPSYAKTYQANLNAFSENTGDIYETLMAWNDLTMKRMEYYNKLAGLLNIKVMLETEIQQY
jgi:outer membrane protein TolC